MLFMKVMFDCHVSVETDNNINLSSNGLKNVCYTSRVLRTKERRIRYLFKTKMFSS